MIKAIGLFTFSVILLFGSISYNNANQLQYNRKLNGKLVEFSNSNVIDNALVTVSENGKIVAQTTAMEDGTFSFENLPSKVLDLSVENVAYNTVNTSIDLLNNKEVKIEKIRLKTHVHLLSEMLILIKR